MALALLRRIAPRFISVGSTVATLSSYWRGLSLLALWLRARSRGLQSHRRDQCQVDAILRTIFAIDVEPDKPPLVRLSSALAAAAAKASDAPLRPLSAAHDSVQEFTFAVRGRLRYMLPAVASPSAARNWHVALRRRLPAGRSRRRTCCCGATIAGAVRAQTDWADRCARARARVVWRAFLECGGGAEA